MKVIQNNPGRLILENRPVALAVILLVTVLILVGAGMTILAAGEVIGGAMLTIGGVIVGGLAIWAFVRRSQIWIDTASGQVAIRERSVTGYAETTVPLADVKEAITQRSNPSRGSTMRRVALRCGGKTNRIIPLTAYYTSGNGPGAAARTINDWLAAWRGDPERGGTQGSDWQGRRSDPAQRD